MKKMKKHVGKNFDDSYYRMLKAVYYKSCQDDTVYQLLTVRVWYPLK